MSSGSPRYDVAFYVPSAGPLLVDENVAPPGGAETQIVLLTKALALLGVRACLVVFDIPDAEIPESVDGVDIVVRPRYQAHQPLIGKVREAIRIFQTLGKVDASVIVTRVAGAQVGLVGVAAKLRRARFVYSSANISDFDFQLLEPKRRDMALYKLGVRLADTVVVQTEEQVAMCERDFGVTPVMIKSIAEPADRRRHVPGALLWIGRLVWYKRPLAFIELARALPHVSFRMVGVPSASEPALGDEVLNAASGVPNLEILPPRPRRHLVDLIGEATAIVNTADFEGMPNIFLEGWARGVPALALTHDPGNVIRGHGVGEFADGSSEMLAAAAERLWLGRADSEALSERCMRYVADHHAAAVVAGQWLDALGLGGTGTLSALGRAA